MRKTVYVLGAGFSKPAGFPLQRELYPKLVKKVFLSSLRVLGDTYLPFYISLDVFSFLGAAGFINHKNGRLLFNLSLEDLFTLLDRVIHDRGTFCGYEWATRRDDPVAAASPSDRPSLIEVRDRLVRSILAILHGCSDTHSKRKHSIFRQFAAFLISRRLAAGQTHDPFSIISLNWDTLLEDSIYRVLADSGGISNNTAMADVDYCVYTYPLKGSPHMPSTKQKAAKIYNLKVLKLHGSATWLRCPNSNVVYTGLGSKESSLDLYVKPRESPLVRQYSDVRERTAPPILEPYIITPSFTKVFDLPQIQATWHNAYVELREASEVIFIGYSLPDADHQVRTLLRRAIRSSATIRVILTSANKSKSRRNESTAAQRFREVFGSKQLKLEYDGVEGFIEKIASGKDYDRMMGDLKSRFARIAGR
jgi:hypothetical protein